MTSDGTVETVQQKGEGVIDQIAEAVVADRQFLESIVTTVLARGHALIEDVPGTGKTLTAVTLADALDLEFSRIQFTPDLLPNDIVGSHVYDEGEGEFEFVPGPVFANVVLADEINRAPPKTQAALLEAMGERQVTVDGETHELPDPFVVIATQNPIEHEGTFELPEAQRDRFTIKTSIGYPDFDGEAELIERRSERTSKVPSVEPVVDRETFRELQNVPESVSIDPEVRDYLIRIARETRTDERVEIGVSPRGVQTFYEVARAQAALNGRSYVAPDDVKAIAEPSLNHRIVLTTDAQIEGVTGGDVVSSVLEQLEVPKVSPEAT